MGLAHEDGWDAWDADVARSQVRSPRSRGPSSWRDAQPVGDANREAEGAFERPAAMREAADAVRGDDDFDAPWLAQRAVEVARVAGAASVGVGALFAGTFLF
ncbi:MAG: hypothetical protein RLZZ383_2641 [Pseudomonadota bacterium]|jgi:hypothetical protein